MDDIRALGANSPEDDRRFATVAQVSEANLGLYRTFVRPAIRAVMTEPVASALRRIHPNRLRFAMFSDRNPWMWPVKVLADRVRTARAPAAADNPLLVLEKAASSWISMGLEALGTARDAMTEAIFLSIYGSPLLQEAVATGASAPPRNRQAERELPGEAAEARVRSKAANLFEIGGVLEAAVRALVYIRLPEGSVDERGFAMLKAIRAAQPVDRRQTMAQLKEVLKEQHLLVSLDEERAVQTLPKLLPRSLEERRAALKALHRMVAARGALPEEGRRRLARVEALFNSSENRARGEAAYA